MIKSPSKPEWMSKLEGTCQNCQAPSRHRAFIEEIDHDQIIIFDDHFCDKCKIGFKTMTTANNYLLFYQNTLKTRIHPQVNGGKPVPFDPKYGVVLNA